MPTLLNGLIDIDLFHGVYIKGDPYSVHPDKLSHAIAIANEFFNNCPECHKCLNGGMGPFVPECDCDLPLNEVLVLRDKYRADPDGRKKWDKRYKEKILKDKMLDAERRAERRDKREARKRFGPTCCPYWNKNNDGYYYCKKENGPKQNMELKNATNV